MIPKAQAIDSKETRRLAPRLVSLLLLPYPLRLLSSLLSLFFALRLRLLRRLGRPPGGSRPRRRRPRRPLPLTLRLPLPRLRLAR